MEARIDYSKGARTKYNLISQRLTRTIVGNSDCHYLGVGEDYWFDEELHSTPDPSLVTNTANSVSYTINNVIPR